MQKKRKIITSRKLHTEIKNHLQTSIDTKLRMIHDCIPAIDSAAQIIAQSLAEGHKLLLCGNGGSAADSQHLAAEFIVRLSEARIRPSLPAIALTTDTSVLTACSNDFGYDQIFSRQVEGLGQAGDVLIAITTSGNSKNVIQAIDIARQKGMKIIGLLGGSGGHVRALCDVPIIIPAQVTHFIQEGHLAVEHILCNLVEILLFDSVPK